MIPDRVGIPQVERSSSNDGCNSHVSVMRNQRNISVVMKARDLDV